ncbi:hypothetical protein M413DRAFT_441684 [Hebeloma cylindrosporum]|uniref:Uncharacterized protein n=1 Tax=Hebeloma cylindrosporum TaxID=76867 RepID=A0A0C2YVL1_HEBCY|nr:hypothetical protein M413DRAFT_441684 [Hebeloma cylindrosporum h7]
MSISMGFISLRNPFTDLVLGKGDLRSMFCLIVFLIVFFILAYLTNPTENSFRSFLTEQSFRHHLSRLDCNADEQTNGATNRSHLPRNPSQSTSASLFSVENPTPFHFANRTSIALRTPKHVFHSFAIFTIAAIAPLSKSSESDNRDACMISDSWYIGAFGKWWRGGDVIARTKDEESWSSGILSIKRLDVFPEYSGPTFSAKNLPAHFARGPPPRLRNRERPTLRHNAIHRQRSSTPPPLPKSASLPMHTTRKPSSGADRSMCDRHSSQAQQQHQQTAQPCTIIPNDAAAAAARRGSTPSMPSSTLFEHSPLIAEVLRQITSTKASVLDIRTQLSECESAASQSRAMLQHEVDNHRERKRQEDASKLELKSRTKSLEDSRRVAETLKKEAEKKFKAVQVFRDGTTQRMDILDKEILAMRQSLSEDRDFVLNHRTQVSEAEREITETLEAKRLEIKTAEDLLLVLNQRSRELEEKLASEKERLRMLRKESETFKENRVHSVDYSPRHHHHYHQQEAVWPSNNNVNLSPTLPMLQRGDIWDQALDGLNARQIYDESQFVEDHHTLSTLSNGQISNLSSRLNSPTAAKDSQPLFPGQSFLPFDNSPTSMSINGPNVDYSATSKDGGKHSQFARDMMIPDGLSTRMEHGDAISRSFQSDSDPYVDKEWRHQPSYPSYFQDEGVDDKYSLETLSPTSMHGPSISNPDGRSFESHFLSSQDRAQDRQAFDSPSVDLHHSTWAPTESEATTFLDSPGAEHPFKASDKGRPLRWFTGIGKERSTKGLNPDAKEFSLCKPAINLFNGGHSQYHNNHHLPTTTYDALNPNGLGSTTSSSSTSQSLLRAFAPSPAEREALQRALGGSTNASFERLPSLSDVGSIPASPTNAHARVVPPQHSGRDLGSLLPAWLQSLPRTRKVNFSPWDDEEPVNSKVESKESSGRRG